ncbi:unnamed protein product, partial [Brenthis ino]
MASTFDDTVLDFDLNFLQQPTSIVNDCKFDKQRKAVLIAKKKTVATDSLIRKYYAKNEKLEQTEVLLLAAKEECKQVCIDYKETLERCSQLEKDVQLLKTTNKELEDSSIISKTQCEALKSHAHQLQVLVKEHETVIEGLKIENHLNKNNGKGYEKKLSDLQKENETILKHLCLVKDIVFGKKKLKRSHKLLLQKYDKIKSKIDVEDSSEESAEENDFFNSLPPSPMSVQDIAENKKEIVLNLNEKVNIDKKVIEDHESDYSNEVVSEDTGRGSSLAFSDGEKCYNSPDYCHADSPFTTDTSKVKGRKIYIDVGTSPLHRELVHIATSPVMFDDEVFICNNRNKEVQNESSKLEYIINEIPLSSDIVTIKEKKKMVDAATSPMQCVDKINVSTSPVMFNEVNIAISDNLENHVISSKVLEKVHASTSPLLFEGIDLSNNSEVNSKELSMQNIISVSDKSMIHKSSSYETSHEVRENPINNIEPAIHIQDLTSQCEIEFSGKTSSVEEKKCLERNNSNNIYNETVDDGEIELILNSMRFTERLITPIPKTPVKLIKKKCRQVISPILENTAPSKEHMVCIDALKLKEENRVLKSSISDLSKEIINIKQILKNRMLMPESPKKQENGKTKALMADLFDDSSQEKIILSVDIETYSDKEKICENVSSSENLYKESTPPRVCEEGNIMQNVAVLNEQDLQITHMESLDNHILLPENNISRDNSPSKDGTDIILDLEMDTKTAKEDHLTKRKTCEEIINYVNRDKEINSQEHDNNDFSDTEVVNDGKRKRKAHSHKLSRLEKFRKKLLPKSKIASTKAPIKKLRAKSKMPASTTNQLHQNMNGLCNSKAPLDNQTAYEKAVNVMKELKLKEKNKDHEIKKTKAIERKTSESESNEALNSKKDNTLNNAVKQPVVCLSQLNLDEMMNKSGSDHDLSDSEIIHYVVEIVDSPTKNYMTRSRSKISDQDSILSSRKSSTESISKATDENYNVCDRTPPRKRLKRTSSGDTTEVSCKRVLRSTSIREMLNNHASKESNPDIPCNGSPEYIHKLPQKRKSVDSEATQKNCPSKNLSKMFPKSNEPFSQYDLNEELEDSHVDETVGPENHLKYSILCKMIDKYGKARTKFNAKKVPDNIANSICKKLEDSIAHIIELPAEKAKIAMGKLVEDIQQNWNLKNFLTGFLKYLKDPARKTELYNKVSSPPAPPMTKSEQVVLYIIKHLSTSVPDIVNIILTQMEFTLFQLNKSPEFDVIESLSHVYALICRYFGLKMRLRLFILDAMYCLSFKVVPLIKQCLDVWMHILPLAHMGIAKSPLVTCLVYLLHFYKCEDRYNRVQDIRFILNRKYFYQITDWNEPKILELFKTSIKEVREIPAEKKMLRMALIILAKRQGPNWCQKNIVKKMLMPFIEQEDVPLRIKQFSVEMLGPLLKPYPVDMKVHCEIVVNNLLDMVEQNPPDSLKESIFTSLIYMSKHNQNRVMQALLSWTPKQVTPEFEQLLKDFVQEKPLKAWKGILSRVTF